MKKKNKKEIIRQCISCRTPLARNYLIRLTRVIDANGELTIIVNPNKFELGRSIYLCKKANCVHIALKGKKISKMLKISINSIDKQVIENIEKCIEKGGEKIVA